MKAIATISEMLTRALQSWKVQYNWNESNITLVKYNATRKSWDIQPLLRFPSLRVQIRCKFFFWYISNRVSERRDSGLLTSVTEDHVPHCHWFQQIPGLKCYFRHSLQQNANLYLKILTWAQNLCCYVLLAGLKKSLIAATHLEKAERLYESLHAI